MWAGDSQVEMRTGNFQIRFPRDHGSCLMGVQIHSCSAGRELSYGEAHGQRTESCQKQCLGIDHLTYSGSQWSHRESIILASIWTATLWDTLSQRYLQKTNNVFLFPITKFGNNLLCSNRWLYVLLILLKTLTLRIQMYIWKVITISESEISEVLWQKSTMQSKDCWLFSAHLF